MLNTCMATFSAVKKKYFSGIFTEISSSDLCKCTSLSRYFRITLIPENFVSQSRTRPGLYKETFLNSFPQICHSFKPLWFLLWLTSCVGFQGFTERPCVRKGFCVLLFALTAQNRTCIDPL